LTFTTNFLLPAGATFSTRVRELQGWAAGLCDRAVLQLEALSVLQLAIKLVKASSPDSVV
jgi:hypothetical protein